MKFYICKTCGNIITKVKDSSVPVVCCGKVMEELVAGGVEASTEKHIPVYNIDNNKVFVMVGEAEHPMVKEHYIEWIAIETQAGTQIKYLSPEDKPAASFNIGSQDSLIAVYAYCNLHGLWKKEHEEPVVCDLKPLDMKTSENQVVCKCNSVKFFDIVDAAQNQKDFNGLLNVFDSVKNTTHCSTGCGGCYNKVLAIISEVLSGNIR